MRTTFVEKKELQCESCGAYQDREVKFSVNQIETKYGSIDPLIRHDEVKCLYCGSVIYKDKEGGLSHVR